MQGGYLAIQMGTFSFAADNSSPEWRTFRVTLFSMGHFLSLPIATPMGKWLYGLGDYQLVYSVKLGLLVLALTALILRLWNFEEAVVVRNREKLSKVSVERLYYLAMTSILFFL